MSTKLATLAAVASIPRVSLARFRIRQKTLESKPKGEKNTKRRRAITNQKTGELFKLFWSWALGLFRGVGFKRLPPCAPEFSPEVALSVLTWVAWYVLVYVSKAQGIYPSCWLRLSFRLSLQPSLAIHLWRIRNPEDVNHGINALGLSGFSDPALSDRNTRRHHPESRKLAAGAGQGKSRKGSFS